MPHPDPFIILPPPVKKHEIIRESQSDRSPFRCITRKVTLMRTAKTICLTLLLLGSPLYGGTKIRMETVQPGGAVEEGWIFIEGSDRLRIDMQVDPATGSASKSMLFDANAETIYSLNHSSRNYVRLDKATMQAMAGQMNQAMRQMQEQLAKMPKEQREMMERMMKGKMPPSAQPAKLESEIRGPETDGEFQKYEVWAGSKKRVEMWTKDFDDLGIPPTAFDVFKKMATLFEELASAAAQNPMFQSMTDNAFSSISKIEGFPVRSLQVDSGVETRFSDVTTESLPAGLFEVPAEYTPQAIPGQR